MFGWKQRGLWLSVFVFFVFGLRGSESNPARLVSTIQQSPLPAKPTGTATLDSAVVSSGKSNSSISEDDTIVATNSSEIKTETNITSTNSGKTTETMYTEASHVAGSEPITPEVTIDIEYKHMTTHNVSDGQNITVADDNQSEGSHLNLAIIPALGVLILLIVGCLKCCKCFRRYTRAVDKEDAMMGTDYAVIVHDGEEEFDFVDIKSDTTSTACYDTVSSYCSFLKRSNNSGSGMTPIRQYNLDNSMRYSSRKEFLQRSLSSKENTPMLSRQTSETEGHSETCDSISPRSESVMSDGIRTASVSSEETEPCTPSVPEGIEMQNNDNRRSQRFKVSFVMEKSSLPKRSYSVKERVQNRPHSLNVLPKRPSLRKMALTGNPHSHSIGSFVQYPDNVLSSSAKTSELSGANGGQVKVKMVTVAIQTNRSFIYKMWRDNKRHLSESGVDGTSIPPTVKELNSPCVSTQPCDKPCKATPVDQHMSNLGNDKINKSTADDKSDKESVTPEDVNDKCDVSIKSNRNDRTVSETDSTDDVFLNNEDSLGKSQKYCCDSSNLHGGYDDQHDPKNESRRDGVVKITGRELVKRVAPHVPALLPCRCQTDLLSQKGCNNSVFENDKINRHSCVARIISQGFDPDKCDIKCPCRNTSNSSNTKHVVVDIHRSSNNILCEGCKLAHVNYSVPCVHCGSYTGDATVATLGIKQLNRTVPRLSRETSLVSVELTSSTTSLESSGYAEISSESSN